MREEILKTFENKEEIPLFYVESGSRLWGIASPDSDWDVRGVHLQSKRQYFDFKKQRDLIEIMDGDFDLVSYDIDKMFGLLSKSNPTVFEWVRAHIVYFNQLPDWSHFQASVTRHFDFYALFHHYFSMARGQLLLIEKDRKFTYKKVFYCIRGLLSADLAARGEVPALLIEELFAQFPTENAVLRIAKESLERKKQKLEKEPVPESERAAILRAIHDFIVHLESQSLQKGTNRPQLEAFLRDYGYSIKEKYYK